MQDDEDGRLHTIVQMGEDEEFVAQVQCQGVVYEVPDEWWATELSFATSWLMSQGGGTVIVVHPESWAIGEE